MKLDPDFISHHTKDEDLLVPIGTHTFSGLIRGNETAGFIFECLKKETTEQEIVKKMCEKYNGSEEQIKKDVHNIIAQLRKCGAVVGK